MITFKELRAILENYNPDTKFVIFRTDSRTPLGTAVGYEAAKEKAKQIRQQQNLKFDQVSFLSSKRFYGHTGTAQSASSSAPQKKIPFGVSSDGKTFTNAYGQQSRVQYSRNYNPSKRGRFRGYTDAQGNYHDID